MTLKYLNGCMKESNEEITYNAQAITLQKNIRRNQLKQ